MILYVLKVDNSEKRINYTPLEVAAYRGGLKIFKVLLEGGANLDMKSRVCIISFMFVFHIWFNINVRIVDMILFTILFMLLSSFLLNNYQSIHGISLSFDSHIRYDEHCMEGDVFCTIALYCIS